MHKFAGTMGVTLRFTLLGIMVAVLSACATQFRNHGYAPTDSDLSQIIVGSDTRETVAQKIGRPTTTGVLDENAWYYVESRFRHFAYQAPKEISREVVVISFDGRGRVSNIERFGLEKGRVVPLSQRITETSGTKRSILQRLLGNLGQPSTAGLIN